MDHLHADERRKPLGNLDWEIDSHHRGEKRSLGWRNVKAQVLTFSDRCMPPHRRYCGLRRKFACIVLVVISIIVVALILGLAIGLSRRSSHHQNLPLGSQTYQGDLTYYSPGLGACGITSGDDDHIVSISHITFDAVSVGSNPNANPLCKHRIRAMRDGKSLDLTVVDRCVGCQATDIDVSPGAFKKLADPALGRTSVSWAWLSPAPTP